MYSFFGKTFFYREKSTKLVVRLSGFWLYCIIKEFNSPVGISTDELQVSFQLSYYVILLLSGINQRNDIRKNNIRKIILEKEISISISSFVFNIILEVRASVLRKDKEIKYTSTEKEEIKLMGWLYSDLCRNPNKIQQIYC